MPMHRTNRAPRAEGDRTAQPWFVKKQKRDKNRKKMAKASKRKNRK